MRVKWAALLSGATILVGAATASAQGPVALTGSQLDGVTPLSRYLPSQFQLRISLETSTVDNPDRARNVLLTEDLEESMATQQLVEESEECCTPARRALLALVGRSDSADWQADSQRTDTLGTSAGPARQTANAASGLDQRLAGRSLDAPIVDSSASTANDLWHRQPVPSGNAGAIRNAASSTQQIAASRSQSPATTIRTVSPDRSSASVAASRAQQDGVPIRTVRSDQPSRPFGANPVRVSSVSSGGDMAAQLRSEVNRTLSAIPSRAISFPR